MILLTPGPVQVKKEVFNIITKHNIFHRSSIFENIFRKCLEKIKIIFSADGSYTALILAGSGTMAIESFVQSIISKNSNILIVSNGHFGDRLKEIVKSCNVSQRVHFIKFGYGDFISLNIVEEEIKKVRPDWLLVVAHETSSGVANPIFKIGKLCKKYNVKFMVDAISAIGGMEIDLIKQNIDVCISVPNKGLEGLPGVSFICLKTKLLQNNFQPRTFCLNLSKYYEFSRRNQIPFTPAIQSIIALEKALNLYIKEGFQIRRKRYESLSNEVIKLTKKAGLEILVKNKTQRFPGVFTIIIPNNIPIRKLCGYLLKKGFVVWFYEACGANNYKNLLQIGVMGSIKKSDIRKCFKYIIKFLEQNGYKK
jgi:2-aminoethylphosphonate-pyruvate transaminase